MKPFLVATDFFSASGHAAAYAAVLAQRTQSTVRLVHVYQLPMPVGDMPPVLIPADELRRQSEAGLERVRSKVLEQMPGTEVETESRLGDPVTEISEACRETNPLIVVAGLKQHSGLDNFLLGNTVASFIQKSNCPVMAVPENTPLLTPQRVALAVDGSRNNELPVDEILGFTTLFGANLQLVHIQTGDEETPVEVPEEFRHLPLHKRQHASVTEGLKQYVKEETIDLLIALPHRHNFFERLFSKTHTTDIISGLAVPVLCIK